MVMLPALCSAELLAALSAAPIGALAITGPFAAADLWAHPHVLRFVDDLLGDDYVLAAAVIHPAGTAPPPPTVPYDDPSLPPSSVALYVPLDGTPASLGGDPTFTTTTLEILYTRPWYVDPVRLTAGALLRVPRSTLATLPPALAKLFARASRSV